MDKQLIEQLARKQAVLVAARLRDASQLLKKPELLSAIEGGDAGRTYIENLTHAIAATLLPKSTLSLKREKVA